MPLSHQPPANNPIVHMPSPTRELIASQRETVLKICQKHGLDPSEFKWEKVARGNIYRGPFISKIVHKATEFYFLFEFTYEGELWDEYSPSKDGDIERDDHQTDWSIRFTNVEMWASYVAREIDAQRFLDTVMRETKSLQQVTADCDDNSPFSKEEQSQIHDRLDALEARLIAVRDFQEDEAERIHLQFDSLKAESARTGRRSWLQMLIGAAVSVIAAFFSADDAPMIWAYVQEEFSSRFLPGVSSLEGQE